MENICIIGSRTIDKKSAFEKLNDFFKGCERTKPVTFFSGGCKKGVDSYVYEFSKSFTNSKFIEVPANWLKYGKSAGAIRNAELIKMVSGLKNNQVIAIWDGVSKGTENAINLCFKYNVNLAIIRI